MLNCWCITWPVDFKRLILSLNQSLRCTDSQLHRISKSIKEINYTCRSIFCLTLSGIHTTSMKCKNAWISYQGYITAVSRFTLLTLSDKYRLSPSTATTLRVFGSSAEWDTFSDVIMTLNRVIQEEMSMFFMVIVSLRVRKKLRVTKSLIESIYWDRPAVNSRPSSVRFWFWGLDEERSLQKKCGCTRRIAR